MNRALKLENEFWTNFSPILQKYAPRKASLCNLKISIFFSIIPLFRLVLKKVLQKVAVKNLSTKSNAQLSGIKFRCALMRPSRASLAHATVNLISLHWVCCFNWLYIFQLLGGFICKIRVSCHICLLEFLIVFKPAFKVLIATLPVQSFYVFSQTNM